MARICPYRQNHSDGSASRSCAPENCDDDNLKALCQRCHNNYDAKMRREGIRRRAMAGQADMFLGAVALIFSLSANQSMLA